VCLSHARLSRLILGMHRRSGAYAAPRCGTTGGSQPRRRFAPGLNGFVWDLKYPGPETLDLTLARPQQAVGRTRGFTRRAYGRAGPMRVEMSLDSEQWQRSSRSEGSVPPDDEGLSTAVRTVRELTVSLGKSV